MNETSAGWLLFLTNLSGRSASTPRVRLWRALKELGVAALRDGVALLPETDALRAELEAIGAQIEGDGGTYWLFDLPVQRHTTEERLRAAFDRSDAYRELRAGLAAFRSDLHRLDEADARRRLRKAERDLEAIVRTDFFPGDPQAQSHKDLEDLTSLINRRFSPQEPAATRGDIVRRDGSLYRGRLWATRRRLWVDRVASAWLIRRFIDPQARFVWLERPEDCPTEALGFDFDGAAFTHLADRVTFEVLVASFGLDTDLGLIQIGRLVHYLDVDGPEIAEAAGFEAVLAGLREGVPDDDALLDAITPVLDALHRRFAAAPT
jgi:hypothetical protein